MRGVLCRVRVRLYSHNRYMEGGIEEETGRWVESVGLSARSGHVDLGAISEHVLFGRIGFLFGNR